MPAYRRFCDLDRGDQSGGEHAARKSCARGDRTLPLRRRLRCVADRHEPVCPCRSGRRRMGGKRWNGDQFRTLHFAPARVSRAAWQGASRLADVRRSRPLPGEIFVPMHWTDQLFSSASAIGRLVDDRTDPVSGQPDLKGTCVRVTAVKTLWMGLLLRRAGIVPNLGPVFTGRKRRSTPASRLIWQAGANLLLSSTQKEYYGDCSRFLSRDAACERPAELGEVGKR
jgi:hypothetical protein